MLREAELFVTAEDMLVEVPGRIRPEHDVVVLPPMYAVTDDPVPLAAAVEQYLRADAALTAALGGDTAPTAESTGADAVAAARACAAAHAVDAVDAADSTVVDAPGDVLPVGECLLRASVARSLLAHYVAAYLGSTACPLPEELARPLWELTAPDAAHWRRLGYFRDPMPLPDNVSWRDRFLLTAGHLPHPLGH